MLTKRKKPSGTNKLKLEDYKIRSPEQNIVGRIWCPLWRWILPWTANIAAPNPSLSLFLILILDVFHMCTAFECWAFATVITRWWLVVPDLINKQMLDFSQMKTSGLQTIRLVIAYHPLQAVPSLGQVGCIFLHNCMGVFIAEVIFMIII